MGLQWPGGSSYHFAMYLCIVIASIAPHASEAASLDISIESWQSAIQRRVEYWYLIVELYMRY